MHPLNPVIQHALYARLGFDPTKLPPVNSESPKFDFSALRPVGEPIAGSKDDVIEPTIAYTYTQTVPLPSVYPKASAHIKGCALRTAMTCAVGIECEHGYDVCPKCDKCTCAEVRAASHERAMEAHMDEHLVGPDAEEPKSTEGLLDNAIKPFWVK